jgi:nicotinamide-nucleotide amidase
MFTPDLIHPAQALLERLRKRGLTLATAESCTGGLVSALLTAIPGSSDVIDRAFVTYSNLAKSEMLGVPMDVIIRDGAVSESVVRAMAEGAIHHARADLSVAITGVAGPGGGSDLKPVGTVHFAVAHKASHSTIQRVRYFGDRGRNEVRQACILQALDMLTDAAGQYPVL